MVGPAQLLPYLEESQLYNAIDFDRDYGSVVINDRAGIPRSIGSLRVGALLCLPNQVIGAHEKRLFRSTIP